MKTEMRESRRPKIRDLHVNGSFLCQDIGGLGGLVVEDNVSAYLFHELDLVLGSGRRNDLEAVPLGKLDDETV